jgi:hypothetical protein
MASTARLNPLSQGSFVFECLETASELERSAIRENPGLLSDGVEVIFAFGIPRCPSTLVLSLPLLDGVKPWCVDP